METHYHIGYALISLVFVGQAVGFVLAAFFNDILLYRLGRAGTLMAAEGLCMAAFIMLICTPPFAVVVVA